MSTTITTNQPFPNHGRRDYWEARARRYAARGNGLAAVCSYGMPAFYNRYTETLQRRALAPFLPIRPGASVLELGCGIGRWTRQVARRGASVVALDLSPSMIAEARRRARADGFATGACQFLVSDATAFSFRRRFDLIFGVTVLQHVLEPSLLQEAVDRVAAHLAPSGRAVFLEVAPTIGTSRCDHPAFVARDETTYHRVFERAGLGVDAVHPVDRAMFRTTLLPAYRALPFWLAAPAMLMATAASIPIDFAPACAFRDTSWHKVFVLRPRTARPEGRVAT